MRSAACDPLPRFCARRGLWPTALPLGPALPSSNSAGPEGPLFAAFSGTIAESDSFQSFIIGYGIAPFLCGPARHGAIERPPRSRWTASARAVVLRPRGAPHRLTKRLRECCLRLTGRPRHSRSSSISGLNSPARTCRSPTLRLPPHGGRRMVRGESGWFTSLSAGTFTRRHSTSSPGAPRVATSSIFHACRRHYPGGSAPVLMSLASRCVVGLPHVIGGSAST